MFIDRTFELFEIFDKNAKSNDEKTALRTNLRRRTENVENEAIHAVPSLAAATEHESSQPMDSMSFINEATNIVLYYIVMMSHPMFCSGQIF